ncbi:MAG: CopG family transcriptional regulator [Chthoniobacterales bacterium]|nr:CopG family transcriptional regulator [Chthoniobacterales bacterium]
MTAEEFDAKFDAGEDIGEYLDFSSARVVPPLVALDPAALAPQKVNVDFPAWVVSALDREADRLGVPRQSLIKAWIVERLETA